LAISLGMIDSVEMELGALDTKQFLPNIVGKSGISVKDNRMRHDMKLECILTGKKQGYKVGNKILRQIKRIYM
jgi:hypothetical protein